MTMNVTIWPQVGYRKRAAAAAEQNCGKHGCDVFGMTRNKVPQRFAVGFGRCQQREAERLGRRHQCVEKFHSIGNSKVSP